ncbi:MAG: phosphatase PAP2 family protein [Actinomycetales bacterium]|nr:phosphatase PAP2 family protein [Actinomycetales bacterium]
MSRKKPLELSPAERRSLAIPGLVAFGIFLLIMLLVITGVTHPFDVGLVTEIWETKPWIDHLLSNIEMPGQRRFVYPFAIVVGTIISYRRKDLLPVIVTVSALIFTNAVTGFFKLIIARGYPRTAGPAAFDYAAFTGDGSLISYAKYVWQLGAFPSGHAANVAAASTLMVMAAYSAREKHRSWAVPVTIGTVIICAITIACSWLRNTHWMTDLLAGIALGISTTIATALWALHLPEQWRQPDLAGRSRMLVFSSGVLFMLLIFSFASSSILSHSVTSVFLVIGVLGVVAKQSHRTIQRVNTNQDSNRQTTVEN